MPILRKREIESLAQLNSEEMEDYIRSLPASQDDIEGLFNFLEKRLAKEECNHSLRFSMQYMMERRLNFPKITSWLNENGGYCDCKVLEQITPEWRKAFGGSDDEE